MHQRKVKQFQILNQLRIEAHSIICAHCKNWLTKQIYLYTDGITTSNYCHLCSLPDHAEARQNIALENILNGLLFPCGNRYCEFVSTRNKVDEHASECIHALKNECMFCPAPAMSLYKLENHLMMDHAEKIVALDVPVLKLTMNEVSKNDIIVATLYEHVFLVHIRLHESTLSVNVGNIKNFYSINLSNNFAVYCRNGTTERIFHKTFVSSSEVKLDTNYNFDVSVENDRTLNVDIYFCDVDKVVKLDACPNCKSDLGLEVYQCANGHNACLRCGIKLNACTICYSININLVNLRFLLPNTPMLCPNQSKGCLAVCKGYEHDFHAKICSYTTVQCVKCSHRCLKRTIFSHMEFSHGLCFNFKKFYIEDTTFDFDNCTYVGFKKQVFACKYKSCGTGSTRKICFALQLLYNDIIEDVQKFRYEIHLLDKKDDNAYLILRGVCQSSSDDNISLWCYYDMCRNLLVQGDMCFRCVIVEADRKTDVKM